jgi:hypothetical protein
MKKTILLFLLISSNIYSQDFLTPLLKKSFALNNHTNRDVTYFTEVDSNGDVIVIGTTERDSTFTDILTTKLDTDLNQIWQKRFSFSTELSYDYPLKAFLDTNNNIYIACFSATTAFVPNSILNILKYDANGDLQWHIDFNDVNGFSDTDYVDYRYRNTFMDSEGFLQVVEVKDNETFTTEEFDFYKINPEGIIVENYSRDDVIDNYNDFLDMSFEVFYQNNNFYVAYRRGEFGPSSISYEHFIKKINASAMSTFPVNDFIDINDTVFFSQGTIKVDSNNDIYFLYPLAFTNKFKVLKLNASGDLSHYIESPQGFDKDILNVEINANGHLSIFCNSTISNSGANKTLNQLVYDISGNLIDNFTVNSTFVDGLKYYSENSLLVFTNASFKLFGQDLNLINEFTGTYVNLNDFNLIDNSNMVVGNTSLAKMYPSSDFFTERNIEIQKINSNQVLNTYNFSGEGTSKAFRQKVIIDNNDNYIVASEEKLGPDNFAIGGSRGPLRNTLYKYDSNLNLLWSLDIDNAMVNAHSSLDKNFLVDRSNNIYINTKVDENNFELIKVSANGSILYQVPSQRSANIYFDHQNNINVVSPPVSNNTTYDDDTIIYTIDPGNGSLLNTQLFEGLIFLENYSNVFGDSYIYMYTGNNSFGDTSPRLSIYKNLILEFETNLAIFGTFGGITSYTTDDIGNFYFSSSWAQINAKLHKISLDNNYSFIDIDNPIRDIIMINDKIFTHNNNGYYKVYNSSLGLVSTSTSTYDNQPRLFRFGNNILSNTPFDNLVKVLDENTVEIDEFKLPSVLSFQYAGIDSENFLILTGEFGNQIPTFQEFGWARGFIHKYNAADITLSIADNDFLTENNIQVYPNPTNTTINIKSPEHNITKVELYDLNGKLWLQANHSTVDISHLTASMYLIKIFLNNGNIVNGKIIKQ